MKNINYKEISSAEQLMQLYQKVTGYNGTLARLPEECDLAYAEEVLQKSQEQGIQLGAYDRDKLIGFIYAYKFGLKTFGHCLANMTMGVDPAYQRKGIGRTLLEKFLALVQADDSITRIELFTPEPNSNAIKLYEKLGFKHEGTFINRAIFHGELVNDVAMSWLKF